MTEPLGSLTDEASRLFAAAESWWRDAHLDEQGASTDHVGADCRFCPLCQVIGHLRSSRPEVVEHLSAAAMSLLQAMRSVVDSHDHGAPRRGGSAVERIDVR